MRDLIFDAEAAAARTPETAAQENMRPVLPKRFYKEVATGENGDGTFSILLDGKPVKTPAKTTLVLPTKQAADLVAQEWREQETRINPAHMPKTRLANTALDGVASQTQAVMEDVVRFASNDLLFYRANHPENLVALQQEKWDPFLDWYAETIGARFETVDGIMHVSQPKEAVAAFSQVLTRHAAPLKLACLHTMTALTGSALIAFALAENAFDLETGWEAAHVDENFNISQWGEDHEAAKRRRARLGEMTAAHELFHSL